jgi:hypothetical protein
VFEGARNLVTGREYVVVERVPGSEQGRAFRRLSKAIDDAVDRTRTSDATHPGWRVLRIERQGWPKLVWPSPSGSGDDGDGEDSLVPRRPRRPPGSGAIALPVP